MADTPAIRITAIDDATAVIGRVTSSLGSLQTAVGSLGAGLSVAAVGAWVKGVVDSAAALQDLSEVTGSSVENLSKLQNQAKVSGVEFGHFEQALGRMAAGMAGADENTTKVKNALAALSVNTKDPAEALQEVALKLEDYRNGVEKAALARDLFGRGGPEFLAMLHDMAQAHGQIATVTGDQAQKAEALEKNIRQLTIAFNDLKSALLSIAVPAWLEKIQNFMEARKSGLGLFESMQIGLGTGPLTIMNQIVEAQEKIRLNEEAMAKFAASDQRQEMWRKQNEELRVRLDLLKRILERETDAKELERRFLAGQPGNTPGMDVRPRLPYESGGGVAKVDETQRAIEALVKAQQDAVASEQKWTEVDKLFLAIQPDKLAALTKEQKALFDIALNLAKRRDQDRAAIDAAKDLNEHIKAQADAFIKDSEAAERLGEAYQKVIKSAEDIVKDLEFETRALTMSNTERETAIKLRQLEASGLDKSTQLYKDLAAAIPKAVEQKQALQDQIDLWKTIENTAHDAFTHIFESGKSVWERLTQSLKSTLLELLYQMTVKKWVIQIAASFSGIPGTAFGSTGGGLGDLFGLGSPFGGSSASSAGGWVSAEGGAGYLGGMAADSAALSMSSIAAAAPYLAAAVVGVMMVKGFLDSKKGGPKVGGSAGDMSGYSGYVDSSGRWATPNQQDAQMRASIEANQKAYSDLIKTLQGKGAASFAQGYSYDPEGKAGAILHTGAKVNGRVVYDVALGDIGRDTQAIADRIALENKRALIAALKASDLPGTLSKVFAKITPESIEGTAADNLIAFATAYESLYDIFNASPLDDALKAVADEASGAQASLGKMADALRDLLDSYDGTAESTTNLAKATNEYYSATVAFLAQIEKMKTSIADMFKGSIKQYQFSKMDTGGKYKYLQDEASALYKELQSSTDANRVNALAQMIDADMREAFGLLTPEQQAQMADKFIEGAKTTSQAAADRLSQVEEQKQEQLTQLLTEIKTALESAAGMVADGGMDVLQGGEAILAAAQTFATGSSSLVTG